MGRREVLRWLAGWGAWLGLGRPVIAAEANPSAAAIAEALAGKGWTASDAVILEVPQLAENGAIVPMSVESRLPDTRRILVFAARNPGPLLAQFHFEPGAEAWVSLRIKLNESGPVLAVAESGGKFYGVEQPVKVMLGGCG